MSGLVKVGAIYFTISGLCEKNGQIQGKGGEKPLDPANIGRKIPLLYLIRSRSIVLDFLADLSLHSFSLIGSGGSILGWLSYS